MNNITVLNSKDEYKDFLEFCSDPNVSILEESNEKEGKLYTFNTGDIILVPPDLTKSSEEEHNDLIFGKDKTTNVVSISVDDNVVYLYKEINNKLEIEVRPYKHWILAPKNYEGFKRLKGSGYYKYIHEVDTRLDFEKARQRGYKLDFYSLYSSEEAALVREGITYFKNMKVDEVSVLAFDIEATTLKHNEDSRVLIISNAFRKNGKIIRKMFCIDEYNNNDGKMIEAWTEWVREINPSIICGHNIFGYDLPYLNYCYYRTHFEDMKLGRDNSSIKFNTYDSEFRKDGSQTYSYRNCLIRGREIVDTMFLSIKYDATDRMFVSYGLKNIIAQLGLEKKDRQHYDASKISQNWNKISERIKIKAYAEHDADDALNLYEKMIPPFFYYTQSIPKTLQQIINSATGSQINVFLVRSYIQNNHSIPKTSELNYVQGGISFAIPGIYKNMLKVDLKSAYPSQVLRFKLYDKVKDPEANFYKMVKYFTEERFQLKDMYQKTKDLYYKNREQSGKIFINSAYGLCNTPGLHFNSPKLAEKITYETRNMIDMALEWASGKKSDYWIKIFKEKTGANNE